MITIAHRLNTIMQSDKIMVLSFGRIIEYDEPNTLAADPNSEFSSLLKKIEEEENDKMPFGGLWIIQIKIKKSNKLERPSPIKTHIEHKYDFILA